MIDFCSNYSKPITDYDSLCNFIESFIMEFEDLPEEDEIDIDNLFRNFDYLEETEKKLYTYNKGILYSSKKTTETSSNVKQMEESLILDENIKDIHKKSEKEEESVEIEEVYYNYPNLYHMIMNFMMEKGIESKRNIVYHISEKI